MASWSPITLDELFKEINKSETDLNGELWNFWQLIKIYPTKWEEQEFGSEGGGFWVVAICGTKVIWYNDIEEGFNISTFSEVGQINQYMCTQYNLREALLQLHQTISSKT